MNIQRITLDNVLPKVFAGAEKDAPVCNSAVWLRQLSFEKGNAYMVEAESGTGKSSLCSFIYGNRRDYSGHICFDDNDVKKFTVGQWCDIRRTAIALLPQEMRLFPELTAMENIEIKNRLTHTFSRKEILDMHDCLEIGYKADQKASRHSIGQQQRVAIVRTLCQPFDFIILDEPVSHLDARNNAMAAQLIAEHARRNGAAIITTSVGNRLSLETVIDAADIISVKL